MADLLFGPEIQKLSDAIGYKPGLIAALVTAISFKMGAPADVVIRELLEAAARIKQRAGE